MSRRFPLAALLGALAAIVFALGACGGDDDGGGGGGGGGREASGGPKTIAVNMYSREIPYFQEILKGMREEAKKLNWTIEPSFANNDPTQQVNQIQNAVTKQPDAMVVIPIDENAIVPPIRQAKQQDIPVITLGDNIAEEARDAQTAFLGVNYEDLGKQKAELVIEELKDKGTVGWVHGIRGLNFSEQQVAGGKPTFEGASGITLVDGPYTGAFSSDKGLSATENLLSREQNVDALFYDNDDIALGGIQALDERGISQDDVFVVGTDGGPAALDAVKSGKLDATFSLCGFAQGKQAIDVLNKNFEGTPPEPTIYTETLLFTKQNVDENLKKVQAGDC
jgi:ABC-type sugar transport system substrate-binding protein